MRSESPAVSSLISKRDLAWAAIITAATLAFFIVTLRPDVGGTEDSPKFQFVGRVLGTSHSPGYPFYAMATWAFGYLPIGNLAYRVNLFSAVCGALSCLCIFLTARRIGVARPLSAAAALAAATSFPVWSNAITAEVYTLAAALSGFAVYWVIAFAQTGTVSKLYLACAMWAMGFGNHLTIAAILPVALAYGLYKNRDVLKPRIALTAAAIGLAGVLQYAFIAIRTLQGAPYLEARATTVMGVFDVIIARDVSWARFYQAQSTVAAIEVPMLLNGLRVNMGTIPILLVLVAIVIGLRKRNPEVMVITGAAGLTLAFIANLWGDVVGFITPVCVQLWPLAALGLQHAALAGRQFIPEGGRPLALNAAGALALIVPVANVIGVDPRIETIRSAGEGPGVRALYRSLPVNSAIVAENYWLARLINYMHFSGEVTPDPNPKVLDNDINDVRGALAEGREVYAFEGATHWLNAQGVRFEPTPVARQPFMPWLEQQPHGTLLVAAVAGRAVPFEWQPADAVSQRPSNYTALVRIAGEPLYRSFAHNDDGIEDLVNAPDGRAVNIRANDDGAWIMWGDDVMASVDRGIAAVAISPNGKLLGQWSFGIDDTPGVQVPPTPYVLRGERACEVLRPGQPQDVTKILTDGIWLATAEGSGTGRITIETASAPAQWRHRLSAGRGEASIEGTQLILTPTSATRPVFRFSMPPAPDRVVATLGAGDITAVRVCESDVQSLPVSGGLEVTADRDSWFGAGWHMAERGGTQRFRWSQRESLMAWRMERQAPVRLILRMRAANTNGTTVQTAVNGTPAGSCTLQPGAWTDCRLEIAPGSTLAGINSLTMSADSIAPDRPGDPRELAFAIQASRVRVGG